VIVKVSLLALVAIEIPVPAAKVNVSVAESATILVWPLAAIFLNAAVTVPEHFAAAGNLFKLTVPAVIESASKSVIKEPSPTKYPPDAISTSPLVQTVLEQSRAVEIQLPNPVVHSFKAVTLASVENPPTDVTNPVNVDVPVTLAQTTSRHEVPFKAEDSIAVVPHIVPPLTSVEPQTVAALRQSLTINSLCKTLLAIVLLPHIRDPSMLVLA